MQPLEGIRVLDLTVNLAGAMLGSQLAQMGAEVIRLESPAPTGRAPAPCRRMLVLDIDDPLAREALQRLAAAVDVVVEDRGPGALDDAGLDRTAVRAIHPGAVYCSISGFGQTGGWRAREGRDAVVQAMSGMMTRHRAAPGVPDLVAWPLVDTFAAQLGVVGVLAALRVRRETGEGECVDVSLLDAAVKLLAEPADRLLGGADVEPPTVGQALVAAYPTRDGHLQLDVREDAEFTRLCRVIGRIDWLADPRFADAGARRRHDGALAAALRDAFATDSAGRLEEALQLARVPAARVRELAEVLDDERVRRGDLVVALPSADGGPGVKAVGPGFTLAGEPFGFRGAAPAGADGAAILRALGYDREEIERLLERHADATAG